VSGILAREIGLVRLSVDGRPCLAYPRLTGPIALGDDVVVNTQAVDLGLGSGGFDVLAVNLTRGLGLLPERAAHVMKLPYTPLQVAVAHGEEDGLAASELSSRPVVCCTLHSQLVPVCAGIGRALRSAYVQLPGGALPVSLSDAVRALKRAGLLELTIAVGACVDGDLACVTVASALTVAAGHGIDVVVCGIGPGIVGTGTPLGHGGLAAADAVNAAAALGGRPIVAPRVSTVDVRERHRHLSHHTRSVLELTLAPAAVAWPAELAPPEGVAGTEIVETDGWREECAGFPLERMGLGPDEDPWFFAASFAAGRLARAWAAT
jgi:hypothetical protein